MALQPRNVSAFGKAFFGVDFSVLQHTSIEVFAELGNKVVEAQVPEHWIVAVSDRELRYCDSNVFDKATKANADERNLLLARKLGHLLSLFGRRLTSKTRVGLGKVLQLFVCQLD